MFPHLEFKDNNLTASNYNKGLIKSYNSTPIDTKAINSSQFEGFNFKKSDCFGYYNNSASAISSAPLNKSKILLYR